MPIVNIYSPTEIIEQLRGDVDRLRNLTAAVLNVEEWPIDYTHISLRLIVVSGILIGDVEVEIIAHSFDDRVNRKDEICSSVRSELEDMWRLEVRVWLHLVEMGYGIAGHDLA